MYVCMYIFLDTGEDSDLLHDREDIPWQTKLQLSGL